MTDAAPPTGRPQLQRARQPPQMQSPPQKRGLGTRRNKPVVCRVMLLDGEVIDTGISKKALGSLLFERVCDHLDLLEKEYFGLTYVDELDPLGTKYWLDLNKTVAHQKKRGKWEFEFALKFYSPDPTVLKESLTRYMVSMQIRKDIVTGKLPCTFATQAVLGSFCVQADLDDYDEDEHGQGVAYIQDIPFAPPDDQSHQLLEKIAELHRDRKGMTPEQAELQYLEYAKKIALYGIHLHAAKDSDYVDIKIGVGASGVSVYRENLRINRFVWPKVLKISYRRNKFLLRIRPGEFETFESWIAFKLPTNKLAKRLWKLAIEHHSFLRLREATETRRGMLPRFGSKYRYSGRTLYEARVNTEQRSQPYFERTGSKQYINNNRTRSMDELPMKHRLSTIQDRPMSADDSYEEYSPEAPRQRPVENGRVKDELREESEPRVLKPSENGTRRPSNREEERRPSHREEERRPSHRDEDEPRRSSRRDEESPRLAKRDEKPAPKTEIKIEHKFVRRPEPEDDYIDTRLPTPPRDEPGPDRSAPRQQGLGVPTALAAVGLPASVRRYDDSADSQSDDDRRPAPKSKPPLTAPKPPPTAPKPPPTAPKPQVKKKPVIVREMDL